MKANLVIVNETISADGTVRLFDKVPGWKSAGHASRGLKEAGLYFLSCLNNNLVKTFDDPENSFYGVFDSDRKIVFFRREPNGADTKIAQIRILEEGDT